MDKKRYLENSITTDLAEKMVFLAGPRQVGKTTLAKQILVEHEGVYLNWDNREDRLEIRKTRWPGAQALVVLDELHKWRTWKSWIKGEFDKHENHLQFLIAGSARLDVSRRGGDSLQGRYHHYRLHPFSYSEMTRREPLVDVVPGTELSIPTHGKRGVIDSLMHYSGFPEPFLKQSTRTHRRWQKERVERFFREDVRDLESIRDFSSMQILADLIPERVGAPLSLNSLREDLEVSHRALTHWMEILEKLYFVFRVRPYDTKQARTLRKLSKTYMWDNSLVQNVGSRYENLIALHLLKFCHSLEDCEGFDTKLFYLRDRSGREVDFLVTANNKPWFAVEAKVSDTHLDPSLIYFRERLNIPWTYQVVLNGTRDFVQSGIRCLPAHRFVGALI